MTPNYDPPSADKYPDGTWERVTLTDYWSARHKLPYSLLMYAIEHQDDQGALNQSAQMFDTLIEIHPNPPDYFYKNAGIAYGRVRSPVSGQRPNHCNMIHNFARFLLSTLELPSQTVGLVLSRCSRPFGLECLWCAFVLERQRQLTCGVFGRRRFSRSFETMSSMPRKCATPRARQIATQRF